MLGLYGVDLRVLGSMGLNVIVGCDFNSRHGFWECQRSNATGQVLFQQVMGGDLTIHFRILPFISRAVVEPLTWSRTFPVK